MHTTAARTAWLLGASALIAACSAAPVDSSDPHVAATASLSSGDQNAAAPVDLGGASSACATDTDCGPDALCVAAVCHQACREASVCGAGASCNMRKDAAGDCYNAPGCNPPPPHVMCSFTCWGYCDYEGSGG